MARTGRPVEIVIDWDAVDLALEAHANDSEISSMTGCARSTLNEVCKRDKGLTYRQYSAQKKDDGKAKLRIAQFQSAKEGDKTMQIWLGKQWLGQTDKPSDQTRAEILSKQLELMSSDKYNEHAGIQLILAALAEGAGGKE